jgi:hypothetical protein
LTQKKKLRMDDMVQADAADPAAGRRKEKLAPGPYLRSVRVRAVCVQMGEGGSPAL